MDREGRIERLLSPVGADVARRTRSPRDWIVDVLAVVLAVLIGLVAYQDVPGMDLAEWRVALDLLLGVGLTLTLFWRRRYPVHLVLLATAISPLSASSAGAALVLLFTVAVHRPPHRAIALGVVSILPFPLYVLSRPVPEGPWIELGFGLAFTAIVVAWGMFVRARRQLMHSLAERARDAEANQAERLERARGEERARIAREMHDVLGHRLSLLSLHAGALEFRPDASPEEVSRTAGVIRAAAHDAMNELRGAIGVLRGAGEGEAPEPPQPTLAELDALLRECRAAGVRVQADVAADVSAVPAALGRSAYRFVQEGLTNARKHAAGARVDVRVAGEPGRELELEVRNPLKVGVGVVAPTRGTGLVGLRERVGLTGGTLEEAGERGGDWVLRARLPWPA